MITLLLILFPLVASALVMFSGRDSNVRRNALIASLAEFFLSLASLFGFQNTGIPEHSFSFPWITNLGISFHFAMDGLSLLLVLLTTFLIPVIILASSGCKSKRLNIFFGLILIMEASFIGVFTAQDGFIFYIFWELALIPAYFITALWGGADRIKITFKFFIYTLTGSLLMLAALIYLYFQTPNPHSSEFTELFKVGISGNAQILVFLAFFIAFAIKIPIIPFHTWQPDTYTTAPAAGSMILAGIMLKMGIYGLIRLLLPICYPLMSEIAVPLIGIVIAGLIYASIIAFRQEDLKRFTAYVSIAHVGLISAGVLSLNEIALNGAVFQMIAHGINIVGLFIVIEIIESKFGIRYMNNLGGISRVLPSLSIFLMILVLGSVALPLTNGFIGEFMILLGLFQVKPLLALFAGTTIIFGVVYMLRMFQKVMYGSLPENLKSRNVKMFKEETAALIPLVILVILMGCYPKPFLDLAGPSIKTIQDLVLTIPK